MARHFERTVIGIYALSLVVFAMVASLLYVHFDRVSDRSHWVQHTLEVMGTFEALLGDLKDVETGQRGYLLAGADDFLEPFAGAISIVRGRLDRAQRLTGDNRSQQASLRDLRPLVERKIEFSERTIAVHRAGDVARAHAMVSSREGKLIMDEIRRRIDDMLDEERRLLALRTEQAKTAEWRTTALLVFGNGIAFALLAIGTIMLGREVNRRARTEEQRVLGEERTALRSSTERSQRRLEAVIDELPVAIVVADAATGDIALRSARMRDLAGTAPLEPRHPDGSPYAEGTDPIARAVREGATVRGEELQLERGDLPPAQVIADAVPVRDLDGRVLGAVGVFYDSAERRRTEAERREASRFRDLFLGALGHDLRNPLSVITAGTASLSRRVTSPVDVKLVNRMASSAHRMARMITQLLDLVQVRLGGGPELELQRMELGALVRAVLEQLDVAYPDRTIEPRLEGELTGEWDRDRMSEVVRNLVENALEHGRPDAPVEVVTRSEAAHVVLEVRNQGNPIPRALVPLMFDPFRRAEERKRMKSSGLGIGLYLAEQIVRAHGGTIGVTSSAETGTTFTVRLPHVHA